MARKPTLQEPFFRLVEKRTQASSELQKEEGGEVKMNQTANNAIVEVRKMSEQSIKIIGGRLKQFTSQWQYITSDIFILNSVKLKIKFDNGEPKQFMPPKERTFTLQEQEVIDKEIDKLLIKGVISKTTHCPGEYISTIFIRPKKDGEYRLILNLKNLNERVEYQHFTMDTLQSAMTPNCYMASVDLQDAYYSVPIHKEDQKYPRCCWKGRLFQFTCLPNGLACASRLFTKILKPVYATLRQKGHMNVGYRYRYGILMTLIYKGRTLRTAKPIFMMLVIYFRNWDLSYILLSHS